MPKPHYVQPFSLSRAARSYQCPKCHAYCMRGLDGDRVAGDAIVDSRPVNVWGELTALLQGRVTYDLKWYASGRYEIDWRMPEQIRGYPPGARPDYDVVVSHRCGAPILSTDPIRRGGPRPTGAASDIPPF